MFEKSVVLECIITFYFGGLVTLVVASYSSSALSLISNIYQSHRMAFKSHVKSLLGLYAATMFTLSLLMFEQFIICGLSLCKAGRLEPMYGTMSPEIYEDYNSVCNYFGKINEPSQDFIAMFQLISTVTLLLPIFVYFCLNDPHDCFICLGKDPDRIYSIFQLSWEDRERRKCIARFNQDELKKRFADTSNFIDYDTALLMRQRRSTTHI